MKVYILWDVETVYTEKEFLDYRNEWIAVADNDDLKGEFLRNISYENLSKIFKDPALLFTQYQDYLIEYFEANFYYTLVDIGETSTIYVDFDQVDYFLESDELPIKKFTFKE